MRSTVKPNYFEQARRGVKRLPPTSLSHEALLAKSKLFAKRGIEAKTAGNPTECQLWAALALELLAKAQLAGIHPSLAVEADNTNSLLEANGVSTGTAVRTIAATTAYARLKHTVPHFSTPVLEECRRLSERRNAELHSGDAACAAVPYDAWEGGYWNAAELILQSMQSDLRDWIGADAQAPQSLLSAHRAAQMSAAKQRVQHQAAEFRNSAIGKLSAPKFRQFVEETLKKPFDKSVFRYAYAGYWHNKCPACKAFGTAAGDPLWEELAEDQDDADYGYELVEYGYSPLEFHCPICGLSLLGSPALSSVGIDDDYTKTEMREISYEPEYGND